MGQLQYNLKLALKNIRRNPVLSSLMIAAIGVGIGAAMTMVTLTYTTSNNPIPHKSDVLFYVQLDSWSPDNPAQQPNEPPNLVTYLDATALMEAKRAYRQTISSMARLAIEPQGVDEQPYFAAIRGAYADFFTMFDTPFAYGGPWSSDADSNAEQVAVLSAATNERLFGGGSSVGETLTMSDRNYQIVGVLDEWDVVPKFYDLSSNPFGPTEDVFIPWSLIVANELPRSGNTRCWKSPEGDGLRAFLNSECVWIQFWAELRDESEEQEYLSFLNAYVDEQKQIGRFPRPVNNRLRDVAELLEFRDMTPPQVTMLLGLSVIFLVVCLLNTVGLLLAKFLGKSSEIGLRRALGASRRTLFKQYLVEASVIGIAGGLLGLALARIGLEGIEIMLGDMNVTSVVQMDWVMAGAAIGLAIFASLMTAIYPTWRACNVQPAAHLNAQ